jgi:hypothetical protein
MTTDSKPEVTEAARPLPAPPLILEEIGDVLEQMGS